MQTSRVCSVRSNLCYSTNSRKANTNPSTKTVRVYSLIFFCKNNIFSQLLGNIAAAFPLQLQVDSAVAPLINRLPRADTMSRLGWEIRECKKKVTIWQKTSIWFFNSWNRVWDAWKDFSPNLFLIDCIFKAANAFSLFKLFVTCYNSKNIILLIWASYSESTTPWICSLNWQMKKCSRLAENRLQK